MPSRALSFADRTQSVLVNRQEPVVAPTHRKDGRWCWCVVRVTRGGGEEQAGAEAKHEDDFTPSGECVRVEGEAAVSPKKFAASAQWQRGDGLLGVCWCYTEHVARPASRVPRIQRE